MTADFHDYAAGILTGDKVNLRRFREDDLELLDYWWNDPEWMVFQGADVLPSPGPRTREMFQQWSSSNDPTGFGFCIEEKHSRTLIGHVTVWGVNPVVRAGTVGVIIGGEHTGKGFGTDAMRTLARFCFEELGLNKLELGVWEYNAQAKRAYEKVGFVTEGIRRAATFHAGRYWGQVQMGLLREEFPADL